jgi:GAF domain-containing protein
VNLAAELCNVPVALLTLLDEEVNWVKVRTGIDAPAMPRETSFCQYTIAQNAVMIIPDTTADSRFDGNPLVHQAPHVRFYAGAPLTIKSGMRLGSLCLFDGKPNNITEQQQKILAMLSRQATFLMELELSHKLLREHIAEIEDRNESLRKIAHLQSHDIRQPLTSIMGLINLIKEEDYVADREHLMMIAEAADDLDSKVHAIVEETRVGV